jgi:DNA-directed RNA polymerase subunit RPC12/RpoP
MRKTKWPGNWKYDCQRCGWTFPSGDIRKEWTGLYVCGKCWEPKHPQLMIRVREETAVPAFKNKDAIDQFVSGSCDIVSSSGYAGLAEAGCAQAGNNSVPYNTLRDLTTNGHE